MLILGEKHGELHVLHVIIGPETQMQFNMTGHSVTEITEFISQVPSGEKCIIALNKCESEEELLNTLNFQKSKIEFMKQLQNTDEPSSSHQSEPVKEKTESIKLRCPHCYSANAGILVDGIVTPCKSCQEINNAIKNKKIPPLPSLETLDQLRKKIEINNPAQKKSISRFYKRNEKDKTK